MTDVPSEIGRHPLESRARWRIALATTSLVAVLGFAFAVFQFVQEFLYEQSAHTRTVGGVLFMVLGVVGIGLPLVLYRKRRRFASLPPSRQWLWAAGIPLAYVLVFAVCFEASLRSTYLILPRPFTPTAVMHYVPGDSRVEFRGGWRAVVGPGGYSDAEVIGGEERLSSHLGQNFIRHPDRETVVIVGRAKRLDDGTVRIVLDVDAKEPIRFSGGNLENAAITRDGQPVLVSDAQSGTFRITIAGRPKKDI